METSSLRVYSLGVVAVDKEGDSDSLIVSPTEVLTDIEGDLPSWTREIGGHFATATIEATWMPMVDFRNTAPNMVVGEKVILYRYADTDRYFWNTMGRHGMLRKKEHIHFSLSNSPGNDEEEDPDNSVNFVLSTREGILRITTPDNDDEQARYDIKIDMKEGTVSLEDNHDNKFVLDSPGKKVTWDVDTIEFNCKDMEVTGNLKVGKNLSVGGNTQMDGAMNVEGISTMSGDLISTGNISTIGDMACMKLYNTWGACPNKLPPN